LTSLRVWRIDFTPEAVQVQPHQPVLAPWR
jgi:hypothetical protein